MSTQTSRRVRDTKSGRKELHRKRTQVRKIDEHGWFNISSLGTVLLITVSAALLPIVVFWID